MPLTFPDGHLRNLDRALLTLLTQGSDEKSKLSKRRQDAGCNAEVKRPDDAAAIMQCGPCNTGAEAKGRISTSSSVILFAEPYGVKNSMASHQLPRHIENEATPDTYRHKKIATHRRRPTQNLRYLVCQHAIELKLRLRHTRRHAEVPAELPFHMGAWHLHTKAVANHKETNPCEHSNVKQTPSLAVKKQGPGCGPGATDTKRFPDNTFIFVY